MFVDVVDAYENVPKCHQLKIGLRAVFDDRSPVFNRFSSLMYKEPSQGDQVGRIFRLLGDCLL
jgi:hypothetical protein